MKATRVKDGTFTLSHPCPVDLEAEDPKLTISPNGNVSCGHCGLKGQLPQPQGVVMTNKDLNEFPPDPVREHFDRLRTPTPTFDKTYERHMEIHRKWMDGPDPKPKPSDATQKHFDKNNRILSEALKKKPTPEGMRRVVVTATRSSGTLVGHACLILKDAEEPEMVKDEYGALFCTGCSKIIP